VKSENRGKAPQV